MNDETIAPHPERRIAVIVGPAGASDSPEGTVAALHAHGVPGYAVTILNSPASLDALGPRELDLVHLLGATGAGPFDGPVTASFHPETGVLPPSTARVVLSPDAACDAWLRTRGFAAERLARWERGVDLERFNPGHYRRDAIPGAVPPDERFDVLHCGRLTATGARMLGDALVGAREREPRCRLVLVAPGHHGRLVRERLGDAATTLEAPRPERLAAVYASAELLVTVTPDDPAATPVLEAQASGLPVLAVASPGARELIEAGRTGCLVDPDAGLLGEAIGGLARRSALCERLAAGGLLAARRRSWRRTVLGLAAGWDRALPGTAPLARAA